MESRATVGFLPVVILIESHFVGLTHSQFHYFFSSKTFLYVFILMMQHEHLLFSVQRNKGEFWTLEWIACKYAEFLPCCNNYTHGRKLDVNHFSFTVMNIKTKEEKKNSSSEITTIQILEELVAWAGRGPALLLVFDLYACLLSPTRQHFTINMKKSLFLDDIFSFCMSTAHPDHGVPMPVAGSCLGWPTGLVRTLFKRLV